MKLSLADTSLADNKTTRASDIPLSVSLTQNIEVPGSRRKLNLTRLSFAETSLANNVMVDKS
jgi:hypothetical protein